MSELPGNPLTDVIFSDFIHSVELDVCEESVASAAKELQRLDEGRVVSNRGGYQSTGYLSSEDCGVSEIHEMLSESREYVQEFLDYHYGLDVKEYFWWANVSAVGDFNVPHNHGKTDLCAVYFAKAPEGSGKLYLERNDGATYSNLYNNIDNGRGFQITPQAGRLYIFPGHIVHWVEPSESAERISFAINYLAE